MSKWLVPLILVGVLAGVLLGLSIWRRDLGPGAVLTLEASDEGKPAVAISPEPEVMETAAALPPEWIGLPVGRFLEQASGALVARNPETVTHLGIGAMLGIGNSQLTPLDPAYTLETHGLEAAVLEHLQSYDLSQVPASERLDARVYGWYLESTVDGHRFADHDYTVHPFITSYPQSLERFLVAIHPLRSDRDAVDYVERLSQVGDRFDELIAGEERSEAIGAIPPRFILEQVLDELREAASSVPTASAFYAAFAERTQDLQWASARRDEFLERVENEVADSVLPAYRRLVAHVERLVERASDEGGVWRHENGEAYYAHLLRTYTTTDQTAEEIHQIGLAEVARIRAQVADLAQALGLDPGLSLVNLYAHLADREGTVTGEETRTMCEGLLDEISRRVAPAFLRKPDAKGLVVVAGSEDAFYTPGSLDGSRPGLFYAPTAVETPRHEIPTLTYHEAIPGHYFQHSVAAGADIAIYRTGLSFTAYAEGWALYAERLAWELGAYEKDPEGDLGRLQAELFRAARLVVDTGIHAMRWTYEQAVEYMLENTGLEEDFVRREVVRYIVLPGQATAYKVGMLKILELRRRAETMLGSAFDLAEFHDRLLREGSVPLGILEELVDAYIAERQAET